jgi:putative peptide zinc metalloprotease protein
MLPIQTNSFRVEAIEQTGTERYYLLTVNGRPPHKVGELIYRVLNGLSDNQSYPEITRKINDWSGNKKYTLEEITDIIQNRLSPLGIFDKNIPSEAIAMPANMGSIFFRRTLLAFENYEWTLKGLKYAFSPALFFIMFVVLFVANIMMLKITMGTDYTVFASNLNAHKECMSGLRQVLLFYPIVIMILLIHELGHAAASYRFGINPKEIGIGLYLIFPVLYTDVTDIWKINKMKRMIVNLGGIYFQMIVNLILIFCLFQNLGNPEMSSNFHYLIQLNIATMIVNIIPFIKFDGYWLYSDFFTLPNLRQQSTNYFLQVIKLIFPNFSLFDSSYKKVNLRNIPLMLYTVCRYLFVVYFTIWAIGSLIILIGGYPSKVVNVISDFTVCSLEPFLSATMNLAFFGYFARNYYRLGRSTVRENRKRKQLN